MTRGTPVGRYPSLRFLGAVICLSAALGGCNYGSGEIVTGTVPNDFRLRHPIAIQEADRSVVIFVGQGRGGLSASQRADVLGLARTWAGEGTGVIVADVPVDTANAKAAASSFSEVQATLAAGGVPSHAIKMRHYRPDDVRTLPTIRLSYPRIAAIAGPCGLWPEDLGPSLLNSDYSENRSYYNFGCANQRNLAAMVDNPSDLVQPRSESPPYTARRNVAFEKYRKGTSTTTIYPEVEKAKLSDTGK